MKRIVFIVLFALSAFVCFGQERLEKYYYRASDGRRFFQEIQAEKVSADSVKLTIKNGWNDEHVMMTGSEVMKRIESILTKNSCRHPKGRFVSRNVKDGKSWDLSLTYSDGKRYSCGGYVLCPQKIRNALDELEKVFELISLKNQQ